MEHYRINKVWVDDAMDMFYNSETIQLMEEGADLHCRSEKYLAEEVWRETFLMINSGVLERMMKLSLLVISMLAAMALPASSQEDSCKTIHRIALDAVPSTIFHTNEFLRGGNDEARTMNHDMTFTLKYAFMNKEEVRPGSIYQGYIRVWVWLDMSLTSGWRTRYPCICFRGTDCETIPQGVAQL